MTSNVGYTIRPAVLEDAQGLVRVHVESWRSSYRGLIAQDFLDNLDSIDRLDLWKDALSKPEELGVYVAVVPDTNEVVGFCSGGINRDISTHYPGELYAIYLLEEVKGRGLGRLLFQEGIRWLRERGLMPMILWALKENTRARNFYERMGGQLAGEQPLMIGELRYTEVAYVWSE